MGTSTTGRGPRSRARRILDAAGGAAAITAMLVARQLNTHPRGQRLLWRVVEPIGFVMERRMLLGIKERAERGLVTR